MLHLLLLKFDSIKRKQKKVIAIKRTENGSVLEIPSGKGDEEKWRGQVIQSNQ